MWERIKAIVIKEFIHVIRDTRTLYVIIGMPIVQLVIYGYALTWEVKHIPLAVRDMDQSAQSRQLITDFRSSGYFDIMQYINRSSEAEELLDRGEIRTVLVIPPDFAEQLVAGERTSVQVLCDGSDPTFGRAASAYSAVIVQAFSNQVTLELLDRYGIKLKEGFPAYLAKRRVWYNPEMKSSNFVVPGLISLMLVMVPCAITSVAIVREKEKGTIENLIVSPVRPFELMLGKIVPYLMLAALDATLITLIAIFWFGVAFRGSVLILIGSSILFMLGTVGLGLFVSTLAETQDVAQMIAVFISVLPSVLLSGFVFPIESMPRLLQLVSYAIPNRYYLVILRALFLKGVGIPVIWPYLVAMAIFGVTVFSLSSLRFVKRLT